MNETMNIVLTVDAACAHASAATLCSIASHMSPGDSANVCFLHSGDLEEPLIREIQAIASGWGENLKVTFVRVEDRACLAERISPRNERLSPCAYLSLYIPEVCKDQKRVLYVDGSVILKSDIRLLYDRSSGEAFIAGFESDESFFFSQALHMPAGSVYLSAAILLWNLEKIPPDFINDIDVFLKKSPVRNTAIDFQDILNCVAPEKTCLSSGVWRPLPPSSSFYPDDKAVFLLSEDTRGQNTRTAVPADCLAIHFRGVKPWKKCMSPATKEWFSYLPESEYWKGCAKTEQNGLIVLFLKYRSVAWSVLKHVYKRFFKKAVTKIVYFLFRKQHDYIRHVRDSLLAVNARTSAKRNFDIAAIDAGNAPVLTFERQMLYLGQYGIKNTYHSLFNTRNILHYDARESGFKYVFFNVFRNAGIRKHIDLLLLRQLHDFEILFVECGFIQSVTNVNEESIPFTYRCVNSYILDDMGFYFDATIPSRIESHLNSDEARLSPEQQKRARGLIERIVSSRISKYNYQSMDAPEVLQNNRPKVLVVDQSRKDASITRGMATEKTFRQMLDAALAENPDSQVIIKTHPDSIARNRGCYFADVKSGGRIVKITETVNPYAIIERVDKVYVCTSQIGLEALMCGKDVSVFGMPVYAGWGLTRDRQSLDRRAARRRLEELVHAIYIKFAVYFNPLTGERCEVEEFIDRMVELREAYIKEFPGAVWHCSR